MAFQTSKQPWLLFIVSLFAGSIHAGVIAKVDKNPVLVNEPFNLEITSDQSLSSDEFDRSDLLALFKVGRTSVSRQTRIVNGASSQSTVWSTLLLADQAGEYVIPSLVIGGERTEPISVNVLQGEPATNSSDLFLSTQVSSSDIYLGQQIILDVKLYYANALQRGRLSDPAIENSEIEQLGEDAELSELVNGRRYRVIYRQYRISPRASGTFKLSSPFFEGEVATSNNNSIFQGYGSGRAVTTTGEDHVILVNPIPESYLGYWLPSESVTLEESWQMPDIVKPGEPITRKISLIALGVSEQQLPKLVLPVTDVFAIYPDQAERVTGELNGSPAAQLTQSFAIIPNQAGNIIIPEVRVPWWDTKARVQRWATLPERIITIGDDDKKVTETSAATDDNRMNQTSLSEASDNMALSVPSTAAVWLQWLFLGLWLLTAMGWWLTARRNTDSGDSHKEATGSSLSAAWSNLKAACQSNDGPRILSHLLIWSNELAKIEQRENLSSISGIKMYFDQPELDQQLDALQASVYGTSIEPWSGKIILTLLVKKDRSGNKGQLISLN